MRRSNASRWLTRLMARVRSWSRDLENRSLAICLAVGIFASLVMVVRPPLLFDFLWDQDIHLQDRFFGWRDHLALILDYEPMQAQEIVIVSVDSESARKLDMYPPWPRQLYAELLMQLKKAGASVVGFDLLFDGPSPIPGPGSKKAGPTHRNETRQGLTKTWISTPAGNDEELTKALKAMTNVVLATDVEVHTGLFSGGRSKLLFHMPYAPFVYALGADTASFGNVVVQPDSDGTVRRADLVFREFQHLNPFFQSFGLRIAEKRFESRALQDGSGRLFFYDRVYPPSFRINFVGPAGTFKVVPFWKALDWQRQYATTAPGPAAQGQAGAAAPTSGQANPFQDKIVLVGFQKYQAGDEDAATRFTRARSLPFDSFLTPMGGVVRPMSGVELQANIVANVLSARYLSEPEPWEHVLIVVFVALLFARIFAGLHGRPFSMLSAVVLFAAIWLVDAFLCFTYLNCLIPVMVPIFGVAFPAFLLVVTDQNVFAFRERRRHTRLFRSLASARLANEIDRRALGELGLEGKSAIITCLVCQLRDLHTITDGKSPTVVISMVNECLREIIASVCDHSGVVNRVWGQGVQALWGAPIPMQESSQVRLAANCCLDIKRRLAELTGRWRREGLIDSPEFGVVACFGINAGAAVCGQIGTESHTEYGALGEDVDLAARFANVGPQYSTSCVVGARYAELVSEQFELRELDKIKLDARGSGHRVFQLICPKGKLPGALEEAIAIYKQGLAAMEERNFREAERLFNTVLRVVPDDGPAVVMRDRCQHFMATPPEPNWDGATLVASQ